MLYGENSVKLGKTYKAMGTIYIIIEDHENANEYLKKAYKIFEAKDMQKFMKEVSSKLKSISSKKEPITNEDIKPKAKKKDKKRVIK